VSGRHRSDDGTGAPSPFDDEYVVVEPRRRHTARFLRAGRPVNLSERLVPIGTGLAVVLILLIAAVSMWGMPGGGSDRAASTAQRSAPDRGSRDDLRPSGSTSATASASPTTSPSASPKPTSKPSKSPVVTSAGTCQASYYGDGSHTANGEKFDPTALTAAHKTLPFNTRVKVTNTKNGKSVVVRINDRGPFVSGRCLDLTTAAFADIASLSSGVITVKYEVLK